ncbi:glutamine-hydrolyzing carbamoyl-phosphate synthase small subunit [Buchnera aphidicola (Chaitoregma tattakana)]|uniref:glutamine-hydrolyzing carbamoyl-phosphate synthase small subunit n=1 Tax=Buchnera aphidicola TaxID=9 RepID=UPI0031B870FD
MVKTCKKAVLMLENGKMFKGKLSGVRNFCVGEIVFNTAMTGYQEIMTDPSYLNQIVLLTSPHIGNTGINYEDNESNTVHLSGLILKEICNFPNHYKHQKKLTEFIEEKGIIAISDIDTRKITRILRNIGIQIGCIFLDKKENYKIAEKKITIFKQNYKTKKNKKKKYKSIHDWDNTNKKSIKKKETNDMLNLIVYDYGIKLNIVNILLNYNCKITIVPPSTTLQEILKYKPHGILLSNGPGDPNKYSVEVKIISTILSKTKIPILGICLGHQLLALSSGMKIKKMKFGHHGVNHPIKEFSSNKIMITSQNHNFSVLYTKKIKNIKITHISLLDNTIQGISIKKRNAFGFQGHPEASPGPHDSKKILIYFIKNMEKYKKQRNRKCL